MEQLFYDINHNRDKKKLKEARCKDKNRSIISTTSNGSIQDIQPNLIEKNKNKRVFGIKNIKKNIPKNGNKKENCKNNNTIFNQKRKNCILITDDKKNSNSYSEKAHIFKNRDFLEEKTINKNTSVKQNKGLTIFIKQSNQQYNLEGKL